MPPCYCDHARCRGATVSKQTLASHRRADQVKCVQQALIEGDDACKEADRTIAVQLSRLSLNPPSENIRPIKQDHTLGIDASYRQKIEVSLRRLAEVESAAERLAASIQSDLQGIGRPRCDQDEFPLTASLNMVLSLKDDLARIQDRSPAVGVAKGGISAQVSELLKLLRSAKKLWSEQRESITSDSRPVKDSMEMNTDPHFATILEGADPIIQLVIFTMVVLQVIMHTSRRGCHFLLSMMKYIVQLSLLRSGRDLSIHDQKLLADFPKDPDSAMKQMKLDSYHTIHAVCPKTKCQMLYAPKYIDGSLIPQYPKYCNCIGLDGRCCGTRLTRPRRFDRHEVDVPVRRFVAFSFKDFVASLTSRPGLEDTMDASWNTVHTPSATLEDVFDGEFLRTFKGPDGRLFGISGADGRYVFSLSVDFFNPYTNKQAGKKVSVGVISIACLNLLISLRYKPENMFLAGIIPGPKEPPLTVINHYLAPLITEFLQYWNPGLHFSQTYEYPQGRHILCALVLVVCDLIATRKVTASGQHNHEHFCNLCYCTRSAHGYRNTDFHNWERRTHTTWSKTANEWLAYETQADRDTHFSQTGVRWSELLRLPYFDMVRCVVVDPMHNLFLGLLKEHFTGLLGIDLPKEENSAVLAISLGPIPSNMNQKDQDWVEKLKAWLERPYTSVFSPDQGKALNKLMRANLGALEFICRELNIPLCNSTDAAHPNRRKYTKMDYARSLLAWENGRTGVDTATEHGHVLQPDEVAEIWSDIEQVLCPAWVTSIPSHLGSPSHGKLKADQWHIAGTVHLPLSLIRLWAGNAEDSGRPARCRQILNLTMSLVSAVIVATSRTITTENAEVYLTYMLDYLNSVKTIFPEYRFRPNHHMALHIYDFLLSFGPVHSWWTFPFERMIGIIQRMPNNGRIGELEETIAHAYTRAANLRTLPSRIGCPKVIENSRAILEHLITPDARNCLSTDIQLLSRQFEEPMAQKKAFRGAVFAPELRSAFIRMGIPVVNQARFLSCLMINGLTYATSSKHAGNSCALVLFPGSHQVVPCQIAYIVQYEAGPNTKTYLGVRRHKAANINRDPYLRYAALRAKIWDSKFDDLEITEASSIQSHFACLPLCVQGKDLVVAISLSRIILID